MINQGNVQFLLSNVHNDYTCMLNCYIMHSKSIYCRSTHIVCIETKLGILTIIMYMCALLLYDVATTPIAADWRIFQVLLSYPLVRACFKDSPDDNVVCERCLAQ